MSSENIQVSLGPFERLEILREERKTLTEQLARVEVSIRNILFEVARQKYLQGLAPHYRVLQPPEGVHRLEQLEQLRTSVRQALEAIEKVFPALETEAGRTRAAPQRAAGGGRPGGFQSFDRARPSRKR